MSWYEHLPGQLRSSAHTMTAITKDKYPTLAAIIASDLEAAATVIEELQRELNEARKARNRAYMSLDDVHTYADNEGYRDMCRFIVRERAMLVREAERAASPQAGHTPGSRRDPDSSVSGHTSP